MKNAPVVLAFTILWAGSQTAAAQVSGTPPGSGKGREAIEALLQATGLDVAADSKSAAEEAPPRSFLVRWDSGQDKTVEEVRVPDGRFTLAGQRPSASAPQWQRFPELSPDHWVVAAVGGSGQLLAWDLLPDPRLLRGELPDAQGELRHHRLYRPRAELWVTLPLASEAVELRIYQPLWDGREFTLEPIASLPVENVQ